MKYIKAYESVSDYDADSTKKYPHVGYLKDTEEVVYVNEKTDYSHDYLTFEALESGTFKLSGKTCQYSLDGGATWTSLASNTDTPTVNAGENIMFKEILTGSNGAGRFSSTGNFNVMGNAYSMISGDNFSNVTTLTTDFALMGLFSGCTKLISAEKLSLPATTVGRGCYEYMFQGCKSLTTPPKLPATTLNGQECYFYMFDTCSAMTTAPELPATTAAHSSYRGMFNKCYSLTTAPALPATALNAYCYSEMFANCSGITTPPQLPAGTMKPDCYHGMFAGCKSLTTAPVLSSTTLAKSCYYEMFKGCTSLTTAPVLSATTLAESCYGAMFDSCISLATAPALPATTLADGCYGNMFYNCFALTTAPELSAATLVNLCYYNMFWGCHLINRITMLATDISATDCLKTWVRDVASSGTFVKNASMSSLPTGNSGIPTGWTVQDA